MGIPRKYFCFDVDHTFHYFNSCTYIFEQALPHNFTISGPGVEVGYFRCRENPFTDTDGQKYREIAISNISLSEGFQRKGLGTRMVREICRRNPRAVLSIENADTDASQNWFFDHLATEFPTRIVTDSGRLTPGKPLDPRELKRRR